MFPPGPPENLWVVEQRRLWGDYGDILVSGYCYRDTEDSPLQLHRIGPFLPPISFPYVRKVGGRAIVVSASFRRQLESLDLPNTSFVEAVKSRIVPLAWHEWDLNAANPAVYPPEGEPEEYLEDEPHDPQCAEEMERAFEVVLPVVMVGVTRVENPRGGYLDEFPIDSDVREVPPMSRSRSRYGRIIVDDATRAWLEEHAGEWVRFSPVRLTSGSGQLTK